MTGRGVWSRKTLVSTFEPVSLLRETGSLLCRRFTPYYYGEGGIPSCTSTMIGYQEEVEGIQQVQSREREGMRILWSRRP